MNVQNLLFYIGKSMNKNVLIYSYNEREGIIDIFNPIKAYWIMREQAGNPVEEMTYLENKFAYGYDINNDNSGQNISFTVKSLPEHTINIVRVDDKYKAEIYFDPNDGNNPKYFFLRKVFLHLGGVLNNSLESIDIVYECKETGKIKKYNRIVNKNINEGIE